MVCTKLASSLKQTIDIYNAYGYRVGITKDKELLSTVSAARHISDYIDWNGVSIVLEGLACVDFDKFVSTDEYVLPATLKERSPRGLHFIYRLPNSFRGASRIGWKKNVDILTKDYQYRQYHKGKIWQGHVLCSPSKGYSRLYPYFLPHKNTLPIAPDWILNALDH